MASHRNRKSLEGKLSNIRYLHREKYKNSDRNGSLPNIENYANDRMKSNQNKISQFPPLSPIHSSKRRKISELIQGN